MTNGASGAIPERVGPYLIQEVIGTGGFATVYRATDERLNVTVAVKVLAASHSANPAVRERFVLEGQRLRQVRGPHLVEVYDLGDTEQGQPYLVLQWADRGDLAARAAVARTRGYRPTPHDGLDVARTVAATLGALHRRDLVHRDLAPTNLLLCSADQDGDQLTDEEARQRLFAEAGPGSANEPAAGLVAADEKLVLADLGMSWDLATAAGSALPSGAAGFAAPEQRSEPGVTDRRSDVWAASALIVWLATGDPPDEAGQWRDRVGAAEWPAGAIPALERGLMSDPEQRHPTIDEWLDNLERLLQAPAPTPAPAGAPESAPAPQRPVPPFPPQQVGPAPAGPAPMPAPPQRRRSWRAVLIAALVGLAIGGVGGAAAVDTLRSDSSSAEGVSASVEGPDRATVGERLVFTAQVDGAAESIWVAPDGTWHSGSTLSFEPTSEGNLTVRLLAADEQGRTVETSHRVEVSAG